MDDKQEKTWIVVHFTDENTVEVVPAIWYVSDTNVCNWPPKHLRRYFPDLVRKMEIPDDDWPTFPAKILGQYDDLQTAKRKAVKAQDTTDLSSNCENKAVQRKIKQNLKYDSTESERELDDSDENTYPALPKKPTRFSHAKELSRMGGDSAKQLVKKIMYRTVSNELGQLFSWDGAKGKRPFKNLLLCQVILKAVRTNERTNRCDEDESIKTVKLWLVRSKDSLRNSLQKKNKFRESNQQENLQVEENDD